MKFPSVFSAAMIASFSPVAQSFIMLDLPPFPFFSDSATKPVVREIPSLSSLLEQQRALTDRIFKQTDRLFEDIQLSSPRYNLVDDDKKFMLSIDTPGSKPEDIDISLEDGFLKIRGQTVATVDGSKFTSEFSQMFSLDPTVDVDKITANLDRGVLTVTAPKDASRVEERVRKIPITTTSDTTGSSVVAKAPAESGSNTDAKNEKTSDEKMMTNTK